MTIAYFIQIKYLSISLNYIIKQVSLHTSNILRVYNCYMFNRLFSRRKKTYTLSWNTEFKKKLFLGFQAISFSNSLKERPELG